MEHSGNCDKDKDSVRSKENKDPSVDIKTEGSVLLEKFEKAVHSLTSNNRADIEALTALVKKLDGYDYDLQHKVFDIVTVHCCEELLMLYILDSIMKNVGGSYVGIISQKIVKIFLCIFKVVDVDKRKKMFALRWTWNNLFSLGTLLKLDKAINNVDKAWKINMPKGLFDSDKQNDSVIVLDDSNKQNDSVIVLDDSNKQNDSVLVLDDSNKQNDSGLDHRDKAKEMNRAAQPVTQSTWAGSHGVIKKNIKQPRPPQKLMQSSAGKLYRRHGQEVPPAQELASDIDEEELTYSLAGVIKNSHNSQITGASTLKSKPKIVVLNDGKPLATIREVNVKFALKDNDLFVDERFEDDDLWQNLPSTQTLMENKIKTVFSVVHESGDDPIAHMKTGKSCDKQHTTKKIKPALKDLSGNEKGKSLKKPVKRLTSHRKSPVETKPKKLRINWLKTNKIYRMSSELFKIVYDEKNKNLTENFHYRKDSIAIEINKLFEDCVISIDKPNVAKKYLVLKYFFLE